MSLHRPMLARAQVFSFGVSVAAWLAIAIEVLTTDPTPREQRIFAGLLFFAVGGLASMAIMAWSVRTSSPLLDVLRAVRRGALVGLAGAGTAFLQFNAALTAPNIAFLMLVLSIVEMIFLARRQHPL